jgi:hypothetical protein
MHPLHLSINELDRRLDEFKTNGPTLPIYDPSNLPQDTVDGQIAIGIDDSFLWQYNGTWYTVAASPPSVSDFPQDAVEGQVAVGSDHHLYWYSNGAWHTAPFVELTGNPPQDAISGQLAIGTNTAAWHHEGVWYGFGAGIVIIIVAGQDFGQTTRLANNTGTPDGTFVLVTDPGYSTNMQGYGLDHNGSIVVMVGDNDWLRSTDGGLTWSFVTSPFGIGGIGFDVVYSAAHDLWVAVGISSDDSFCAASSADGILWDALSTPYDSDGSLHGIAYSPDLDQFIAVGNQSVGPAIMTSDGGVSAWTEQNSPMDDGFGANAAWSHELSQWVVVGSGGDPFSVTILTSSDGSTWTHQTVLGSDSYGIGGDVIWVESLGLWVVGIAGTFAILKAILTSSDGLTWNPITTDMTDKGVTGLTWSQSLGQLIAVTGNPAKVYTSPDAVSWTPQTPPPLFLNTNDVLAIS